MDVLFASLEPHLVGLAGIALALVAAAHAVLGKRDVRAAVGWVGFILFVPFAGAILYFIFGVNRIRRRAKARLEGKARFTPPLEGIAAAPTELSAAIAGEPGLERLARLVDEVTHRQILRGNRIEPLVDGEEAYPAMLAAIGAAERSVTLSTYIFDNDRAGGRFVDALAAARARGVAVRVLIDDAGARYSFPSIVSKLRRHGIPVARFMRSFWPTYLPYVNLRNHRKILVVDGVVAFTGGMNIRLGHLVREAPKGRVQDLHFRVAGPIVTQLQAAFAEDWAFTTREYLVGEPWFAPAAPGGDTLVRAVVDGPDEDFDTIRWTLLGALACARRSVRIATPYFLPDAAVHTALDVAAMRGVDVQILLPEENNLALVQWASTSFLPELLEHGCRVHLSAPPFDHSKLMVVDEAWSFVGSANWDPRSLRLNFELNLEVYGRDTAARLLAVWDAKKSRSRPLTLEELRKRSLPVRLRDGVARLFSPYL